MHYKMLVEIPIYLPDEGSIQKAKATSEIWLKSEIPDAKLISFEKKDGTGDAPEKPLV